MPEHAADVNHVDDYGNIHLQNGIMNLFCCMLTTLCWTSAFLTFVDNASTLSVPSLSGFERGITASQIQIAVMDSYSNIRGSTFIF